VTPGGYAARRAARRHAARARLRGWVSRPASDAQRRRDPWAERDGGLAAQGGSILGAAALHAAIVIVGAWVGPSSEPPLRDAATRIEIREPPPPPPAVVAPPPAPPPSPPVAPVTPQSPPPPVVKAPPRPPPRRETPPPEPVEEPRRPPPRVVGLNLGSTQPGGSGPVFATGNDLGGETGERAADPETVVPGATGPIASTPPASPNQTASRLPVAGSKIVPPKRRRPARLVYPPTLQAQGVEADVTVIVNVEPSGRAASVKIAKGTDYPELDEAARKAALDEEFEPATRDGVPMPYTLSFTYRFRLEDK
jgi:periplasmic protein TonB